MLLNPIRIWAAWHIVWFPNPLALVLIPRASESENLSCMTRSLLLSQINARRSMEDRERICLPITTNPCTMYNCTIGVFVFVFVFLNWEKICLPMMHNDMSSNYQHTIMYNCTIDLTQRETSKYIPQLLRQQPPNVWHRVYCSNNVSHCFFLIKNLLYLNVQNVKNSTKLSLQYWQI